MTPDRTPTVSVSLPESLLREVDRWVGKRGYRSRAEFIKEATRLRLEQQKQHANWLKGLKRR